MRSYSSMLFIVCLCRQTQNIVFRVPKTMSGDLKILTFSWNASGVRLCETDSKLQAEKARSGFMGTLRNKKPCLVPDFFAELEDKIKDGKPHIVALTTQDEAENQTYFHAEFLPERMAILGYREFYREKLQNVGLHAFKTEHSERIPTGKPGTPALRFSVYVREDVADEFEINERDLQKNFSVRKIYNSENKAGALATYLWHNDFGNICLVAVNFPVLERIVRESEKHKYERARGIAKERADAFLGKVITSFYYNEAKSGGDRTLQPDYLIVMGDFGYNINGTAELKDAVTNLRSLKALDEFQPVQFNLNEGVNNSGPSFAPTWALKEGRREDCTKGCYWGLVAGWRDRVVYGQQPDSSRNLKCTEYAKVESTTIRRTVHNAVTSSFTVGFDDEF